MDRVVCGGAKGACDEATGRTGGDGQRQKTEGGQGHPLSGSGCVGPIQCQNCNIYPKHSVKVNVKMFLFTSLSPGVFDECDTEVDVLHWSRHNVFLLYDMGIFTALLELLSMEIE